MATILVVDDHPDNRAYLTQLLGAQGHRIVEACDGAEALDRVHDIHPDLVIADILMPTMDGCELAYRLHNEGGTTHTPVILHTAAYHEREVRPLVQRCGVQHVLAKPADPEAVLACVGEALGTANLRRCGGELPLGSCQQDDALVALSNTLVRPQPHGQIGAGRGSEEFKREHTRVLTNKLSQKADELETANMRLQALVRLVQRLASEHDPQRLCEQASRATRALIGARYASVCILEGDGNRFRHVATSGAPAEAGGQSSGLSPANELLDRLLRGGAVQRMELEPGQVAALGFPAGRQPAISFLGAPILSDDGVYGLLLLVGKLGALPFSDEDAELSATAAAQVAISYENALRHDELLQQADALREAIVQQQRVETEIRELNARLEDRVAERTADLARSNAELEQFAYVAAHDLQEPLRKVVGYTQLLADLYRDKLDETAHEFIDYAVGGALRMQTLIQDLLTYSRVGRKQLELAPTDLEGVLSVILSNLQEHLAQEQAEITHDPLPTVAADHGQLVQLFQNLVSNAVKFHGPDTPHVHISVQRRDAEWEFSVRDNGIGIEEQYFERIFIIFQRLHTREEFPGTGIGLAICKKIVERHGGRLWVESQPGHGTTFFFTLPENCSMLKERTER